MSEIAIERDPKRSRLVLPAVLGLIGLPVILAVTEGVRFHFDNRSNGAIVSSGQKREYLLHVPITYDRTRPTPVVFSMHGAGLGGAAQKEISQWNDLADREGFIVVYPSGVGGAGPRVWRVDGRPGLMRDVEFISALIDTLAVAYNIDSARIYASGLSNGGGMAFALSCALSGRIAAVGMVAAAQTLPWSWCTDARPMPMIAFHGTADRIVPYAGGSSWMSPAPFPNVRTWTENWARRNRCAVNPVESTIAPDVSRLYYAQCADSAAVVLYTVRGGGHSWPGGKPLPEWLVGRTSSSINATEVIWAFFREHRLMRN